MNDILTKTITQIFGVELCNTYNSYIVKGEKKAVIDLMLAYDESEEEMFVDADYVVFTQTTPRCAALIGKILEKNEKVVLVGTAATLRNYKEIINRDFNEHAVKNGETLDLGGAVLEFYITPNLKQPDTMMIYEKESRILFSGNMYSYYDTGDGKEWFYNDNLAMYEEYVRSAQEIVISIAPERICPYIGAEIDGGEDYHYEFEEKMCKTASVYYSSRYGYTRMMAEALAEGLKNGGVPTQLFDADVDDWEDMCAALDADILMIGSSTTHRNAAKSIWKLISEIKAADVKDKVALAFGSYGWSGEAIKIIENLLKAIKVKVHPAPQTAIYRPMPEQLDEIRSFAEKFAADAVK